MIDEVCFGRRKYHKGDQRSTIGIIEMQLLDPSNNESKELKQVQYITWYVADRKESALFHVI